MGPVIDILIEAEGWERLANIEDLTRAAVGTAVAESGADVAEEDEFSVLLCDDARIRELNRQFRGIDKSTNVLSFPPPPGAAAIVIGDIAVAFETVEREALEEGKSIGDHYAHMVVHGLLHVLGYDHETDDEAEIMEALERRILKRMGIDDPYRLDGDALEP